MTKGFLKKIFIDFFFEYERTSAGGMTEVLT